jgi:hypothetical protein
MSWGNSGPKDHNLDALAAAKRGEPITGEIEGQQTAPEALASFRNWFLTTTFLGSQQMAYEVAKELDRRIRDFD